MTFEHFNSIKKILVMCLVNPSNNPRPNRLIKLLHQKGYLVDTLAYKSNGDLNIFNEHVLREPSLKITERLARYSIKFIRLVLSNLDMKIKLTEKIYCLDKIKIDLKKYDLVIIEDIELLPFAVRNNAKKIICDLREFYPLEFESDWRFKILESSFKYDLCKNYLKKCDEWVTVSTGLSKGYEEYFNIKPKLVRSTPYYYDIKPSINQEGKIRMVHLGSANPDRKLENMIKMFYYLDERFFLDFYLVGNKKYISKLKEIAKPFQRIRFLEPVNYNDIIPTLNQYDIGVYLLEPTGFNTKYSLPNKFFEYIQARLMLAIGPTPDMKKICEQYKIGIVSNTFDPSELAEKLNKLSYNDILKYKENADLAAKELCFENESKKLIDIIEQLLMK